MSQIICGLCGKFFSVKHYDPEKFEDDIKRVQVRGKGRGKGTERAWTVSIFEDEDATIFLKLKDRIAKLYSLFFDDEDRSDEWEKLQDAMDDYEEEFDGLLAKVNDALGDDYEEFAYLADALEALIVEYHEAVEETEDGS